MRNGRKRKAIYTGAEAAFRGNCSFAIKSWFALLKDPTDDKVARASSLWGGQASLPASQIDRQDAYRPHSQDGCAPAARFFNKLSSLRLLLQNNGARIPLLLKLSHSIRSISQYRPPSGR